MKRGRKKIRPSFWQKTKYYFSKHICSLMMRKKFGYRHPKAIKLKEPTIIMSNHLTDNDLMFIAPCIKNYLVFACSEHLTRANGFLSALIRSFKPVLIGKGSVAIGPTRQMIETVRDGNCLCLFPEGSRTFDGITNPIAKATGNLVKMCKCALLTYHLEGGYFVQPRWTSVWRKGRVTGYVKHLYSAEEVSKMSADEIYEIICSDLYENAYERQLKDPKKFTGDRLAEGIENILYICPECGQIETISSKGNEFACTCGMKGVYDEYGMLNGTRFRTVPEWENWENEELLKRYNEGDIHFSNDNVTLSVINSDHTVTDKYTGLLEATKDGFKIGEYCFPFLEIEATEYVDRGNTFLFTHGKTYYMMKATYMGGYKYRWLYLKKKEIHARENGLKFDPAK